MPYENMISLRLDDRDRRSLEEAAGKAGLTRSEYLRSLLRVPPTASRQETVYVVDGRTLAKLATELIRWGRHYNQAVHALNTVALYARKGMLSKASDAEARIDRARSVLEEVEGGRRELEYALCEIAESVAVGRD